MQPYASLYTRAALAARFFSEIDQLVASFTALAEEHGARTLSDLFYLHAALLSGGFIDAYPGSKILQVVDVLPSSSTWREFISIYDESGDCVHSCPAENGQKAMEDGRAVIQQDRTGIELVIDAARRHGESSDQDHEVGDLQDALRQAWATMSPVQRLTFLADDELRERVVNEMPGRFPERDYDVQLGALTAACHLEEAT